MNQFFRLTLARPVPVLYPCKALAILMHRRHLGIRRQEIVAMVIVFFELWNYIPTHLGSE